MADRSRDEGSVSRGPNAPIPRLWKATPPPENEAPAKPKPKPKSSSSSKAKSKSKSKEPAWNERKPGEIEPTPVMDTVESRQRARLIVGIAALGVLVLTIFLIVQLSGGGKPKTKTVQESDDSQKTIAEVKKLEREANLALTQAKTIAGQGKLPQSVIALEQLIANYGNTNVAAQARESLKRHASGKSLFPTQEELDAEARAEAAKAAAISDLNKKAREDLQGGTPTEFSPGPMNPSAPSANAANPARTIGAAPFAGGRGLPVGFKPAPTAKLDPSGWPSRIISERDGMEMVFIPGGAFQMGSDGGEPQEAPAHPVALPGYYMDQHEVTVAQFEQFRQDFAGRGGKVISLPPEATAANSVSGNPVVMITHAEAAFYATWAGKLLPTEAQWEFALRSPDNRLYPQGPMPPRWKRKPQQIDTVMSYDEDKSVFGVFDLTGNAWEWVRDPYDARYFQQFRNSPPAQDPAGPAAPSKNNSRMTVKGGSADWRASWRDGVTGAKRLPHLGFRTVLELAPRAAAPNASGDPKKGNDSGGGIIPF